MALAAKMAKMNADASADVAKLVEAASQNLDRLANVGRRQRKPAIDRMRVAVHESWKQRLAAQIDPLGRRGQGQAAYQ